MHTVKFGEDKIKQGDFVSEALSGQHSAPSLGDFPLLRFDGVSKNFGGVTAVDDVSLDVRAGEVLALLGENGAGKSTLIKMLAGVYAPDGGRILLHGKKCRQTAPRFGESRPVAFIHQDLGLIEWMTVAENIAFVSGFPRRGGLINWRGVQQFAERTLEIVNLDIDPGKRVRELSRADKSLVAIARALAADCELLVLDEPTASLPTNEADKLFTIIRSLRARNIGIIYVSHRLDEIFQIADRVAVLRDGQLTGECLVADTNPDELVRMIIGRNAARLPPSPYSADGTVALRLVNFSTAAAGPVTMEIRRGEIVALAGLRGAGQESIGRALFGCMPHYGDVLLSGEKAAQLSSPREALNSGIGLIARDRSEESVMFSLTVCENTFVNPAASGRSFWHFESPRSESLRARDVGRSVGLSPNAPQALIESFSGGNQQKVVVGRWLATGCPVLIAEDPTSGVDIGARTEIYKLMHAALGRGLAILLISTDFEEVAKICHRALVFSRGQVVTEISGETLTADALLHSASVAAAA